MRHRLMPVEKLELTPRTLSCLKHAGVDKVGEVLEMSRAELLRVRNFGEKSYQELYGRMREMDLLPPDMDPENDGATGEGTEDAQ